MRVDTTPMLLQIQTPSPSITTVQNQGPGRLYYRSQLPVSSTVNDGSVAAGATQGFTTPQWIVTTQLNPANLDVTYPVYTLSQSFTSFALPVSPSSWHTFGAGVAAGTVRTFNLGATYATASHTPAMQITVQNGSSVAGIASQAYDIMPDLIAGFGTVRSPRVLNLPSCPPAQSISYQIYGSPIGVRLEIDTINDIVDASSFNVSMQAWAV
jgi:hypothetical protein